MPLHLVEILRKVVPRDLVMVLAGYLICQVPSMADSRRQFCKIPIYSKHYLNVIIFNNLICSLTQIIEFTS